MSRIIIVSNRLPVKISKEEESFKLKLSEGGLATGLGSVYKQNDNIWIGWCGTEITDDNEKSQVTALLQKENLLPVFLSDEEILNYYEGFSNEILWPIFHYMSTYAQFEQKYWDYYQTVNEKFKNQVLAVAKPGDTIWIHDYQLLLLPKLIRDELKDVSIGFFQHIPFPSFELFRLIPWRAELLNGMLGADLIGFHTYDDVRHFTSSATRSIPVHATANIIQVADRNVLVDAFPMGIDATKFESLTKDNKVQEEISIYNEVLKDAKMILSVDRLDYSKGILQRLMAFEKVLTDNPEYIEKISLHMIVVPSRDSIPQYKELRDDIDKMVGNINARFRTSSWHPIHYFYRSFPVETLVALYSRADICLVTPMRDGMNLVSKEYIASRKDNGVLILSEMAGASKELTDALIVNPNNLGEMYRAIIQALEMPEEEQKLRMLALKDVVNKFDIHHWVKIFMDQLKDVKVSEGIRKAKSVNAHTQETFIRQMQQAQKRVFFLDYDGTLVGFKAEIDKAYPDDELYELLNRLNTNPRNQLVIISGRKHETLEQWFGHLTIDLIAEHGAWYKINGQRWATIPGLSDHWKTKVRAMLEAYSDRTPGSFIEEKRFSLAWHFRKVEKGLGELRANELESNLRYLTREMGLQVLAGNKVLEIKSSDINKGKAAFSYLLDKDFDFIMALGDDHTDEDTFQQLPQNAITIKVGSSVSAANYYVNSVEEVRTLLKKFLAF
ncbi:bifunctional alpha,alpha-trehalose-phosphate synthase (UDP-forming)/trehalose-phosphatase [Pedobacter glucosidilyticus]|uniref:bifunctional alpha,alpha-trehalose-phosphate synthase (UDP-forming)/trehalose-phosphatase n=1 Tax=Pedobacter glucosidilyticus TaxID=1122941 RepID=UPI0026F10836|nr:bifunctional alpha,alpha-trehalose-phosphate synthase (UDP-forming)/trehalose-phosphatase [Pedobacter glucosidilyticus]